MQTDAGVTRCPQCSQQLPVDARYVTWCDKCDWNVDPTALTDQAPAWRQRLEHRLADTLYRELEHGRIHRPGWDLARVTGYLLSAVILLLPLAGLLGGIALLVFSRPLWISALLSLVPFSIAVLFRPRPNRLSHDAHLVHRDQAPLLFALLDRIATAVGTKPVGVVALEAEPNIYFLKAGWRFTPVVGIGDLRAGQRAEYLADRRAAETAGSDAAAWALERSVVAETSYRALEHALRFGSELEPLEAATRAVREIPAREVERRLRVSRLETRIDSTHPPTNLRVKLIRARPAQHALVVLGTDESRAIDRELAGPAEAVLAELRSELR